MKWSDKTIELKNYINSKIPSFVRGFADRAVTKAAETIAVERGAVEVETVDVVRAYFACTPKAMYGLLTKALVEKKIEPSNYGFKDIAVERKFPIGELMTIGEVEKFLNHAVTGRLGTCAQEKPYVVPLSFVYLNSMIYYHWFSYEGRKLRNIMENNRVCFEADEYTRDHMNYASVIADGRLHRVTDKEEKAMVLRALAEKFPAYAAGEGHNEKIKRIFEMGFDAMVEAIEIFRIEIEEISGKKKGKPFWK